MKKVLKNYNYLAMMISTLISLILLLVAFFVPNTIYFTAILVIQILLNFSLTGLLLLGNLNQHEKFKWILIYLSFSYLMLIADVLVCSKVLDMNNYANVMYITNAQMYLALYFIFVIGMCLIAGYSLIKNYEKKTRIR